MFRPTTASTSRVRQLLSREFPLMLLLIVTLSIVAHGQVLYGSLTGTVKDPKGAAVTGVTVSARNVGTGAVRDTTSDADGNYQLSSLQPGVYSVTFSYSSFKTRIQENVMVDANATRRVDADLEVADVKETVVVTSEVAPLQTDRADVNTQLQATQIADLPIATAGSGRNYQGLYRIVPGFSAVTEGVSSDGGNPQRSMTGNVNGNSMQANLTRIDGASNQYIWLPFNTAYVPPTESIESVSIVTNSYDAEQGNANGAAVSVITKSGTNDFHGSAFEFHTDNALKAFNRFNPVGQRKPKYILNQFGGAVGGPIYLPQFGEGGPTIWSGKNKLFFFTDLERTTQRNAAGTTASVAPASLRPDASGNVNFTGTGITVYDPASNANPALRTPFANNTIPANRIDIAAIEILRRLPLPNQPGFTNNFATAGTGEFNRTNMDIKINYDGGKLTLFGRYSRSPTLIVDPPIFGEVSGPALNGGQLGTAPGLINVFGIGGTYSFTPAVVLDANIGYTRQRLGAEGFDIVSNFGLSVLQIPGTNGPDRLQGGVPSFQIGAGWTNIGNDNTGNPFLFRDNQYVGAANLSWLKGAHSFRFGGDYL